jgi:hypothetical protein
VEGDKFGVVGAKGVEDKAVKGLPFNGVAVEEGGVVDVVEDVI